MGLLTKGKSREDIARAVHRSIVSRTLGLFRRVSGRMPVVFSGGVGRNRCVAAFLAEALGQDPLIPEDPQMVGAYGAALIAAALSGDIIRV